MMRMRVAAVVFAVVGLAACGAEAGSPLFSFLPAGDLPPSGEATLTTTYSPSGSTWAEGLDERTVFHAELAWRGTAGRWWCLRVGQGGQVCSFRGPFGESVPPQVHADAPWVDEVWQIVSVSSERLRAARHAGAGRLPAYFIHGSGIYLRDPGRPRPFYCPILATDWDPAARRYGVVAWGQHAHVPSVYRSGALYYTVWRALAGGVVEVVYAIHNFGPDVLDYFNTPWGGVRRSALPVHLLSRPDGTWREACERFGARGTTVAVSETGGWSAFVQRGTDPRRRWGLGLVFGRDAPLRAAGGPGRGDGKGSPFSPTRYRWGCAGNPDRPNPRDYFVAVVNPRCRLRPGQTFWFRAYFVVDTLARLPETARRLVPHARFGRIVPERQRTPLVAVAAETLGLSAKGAGERRPLFRAYAWPAEGTVPLFLLRETATGRLCLTDDPYRFASAEPAENPHSSRRPSRAAHGALRVLRPYDGRTEYLGLLGYAVRAGGDGDRGPHPTVPLAQVLEEAGLGERVEAGKGLGVLPPAAPTTAPAGAEAGGKPGGYTRGRLCR